MLTQLYPNVAIIILSKRIWACEIGKYCAIFVDSVDISNSSLQTSSPAKTK